MLILNLIIKYAFLKEVIVIDNYDSFTFNIVHYLEGMGAHVNICRNDKIDWELVKNTQHILLSPVPGLPDKAGDLLKLINKFHTSKSILGICLGHQAIAQYFGHRINNMKKVLHGKTSILHVKDFSCLFQGLPSTYEIGHYHSWIVEKNQKSDLITTAFNDLGEIMAFRHKQFNLYGVQFHPESILSEHGRTLLFNWLKI